MENKKVLNVLQIIKDLNRTDLSVHDNLFCFNGEYIPILLTMIERMKQKMVFESGITLERDRWYGDLDSYYLDNFYNLNYLNSPYFEDDFLLDNYSDVLYGGLVDYKSINLKYFSIYGHDQIYNQEFQDDIFSPLNDFLNYVDENNYFGDTYFKIICLKSTIIHDYYNFRENIKDCVEKEILDLICEQLEEEALYCYPTGWDNLFDTTFNKNNTFYRFILVSFEDTSSDLYINGLNTNLFLDLYLVLFDYYIDILDQKYHFIKNEHSVEYLEKQSA